ncbi:MAG: hypothetical protein QW158_04510 [Nitrososphaerales archaeon]
MNWNITLEGRVRIRVHKSLGGSKPIEEYTITNLVVSRGKSHICDLLIGASTESFAYCGVGSSDQAPSPSDTDLIQPIGSRKQVTDRFRSGCTATFSTFFSSQDNNGVWREAGLFTSQSGGVMLSRAVFPTPIVKDETKTITLDWDITVD